MTYCIYKYAFKPCLFVNQAYSRWGQEVRFCKNDYTSFARKSGVVLSWLNHYPIDRFLMSKFPISFVKNDYTSFYQRSGVGLSWLNHYSIDRFLMSKFPMPFVKFDRVQDSKTIPNVSN